MKKFKVETKNKVMNFMDFQNFIKDLFFDEVTDFDLKKEVKYFEDSQILYYTVTFKDGSIVSAACVTPIQ